MSVKRRLGYLRDRDRTTEPVAKSSLSEKNARFSESPLVRSGDSKSSVGGDEIRGDSKSSVGGDEIRGDSKSSVGGDEKRGDSKSARIDALRAELHALKSKQKRKSARAERVSVSQQDALHQETTSSHGLPGTLVETLHGTLHEVRQYLEPHHHHGQTAVAAAIGLCATRVAQLAIDPSLEGINFDNALYFDTETTGLAGGMGTVPFLVGVGHFEDRSLCLEQYFLPELGNEKPILKRLAEQIAAADCLVSFNGKTFDWPLLRNRFVANRVKMPKPPPHLDLLHCARRVLRPRLGSVRLVALERHVLGFYREDDVPGALIPQIYFDYLDGGDPAPLVGVFEHNAHDLVALAALLANLTEHFEEVQAQDDPLDHLAYAKVAARNGDAQRAHDFAMAAARGGGDSACTVQAWMVAARIARNQADLDAEEHALRQALEEANEPELEATVALALSKLMEHRRKDLQAALALAARTMLAEGQDANARRVARLERRLSRQP